MSRDQIDEIKRKLDIVSVVQEHVPGLKKSGRNHFGLCPFHNEKTPSFSVNSELGIYKCFGCGESGDVISFIEKIEGIDFPDALEIAAKKAAVTLERTYSPEQAKRRKQRQRLLEANELVAKYLHFVLAKHELGKPGRKYARGRNLKKEELIKFQIGYAPDSFENQKMFLEKRGFARRDLANWGLLVEKNGRVYDKFRGRLMFPIKNHLGETVGFSGRVIDPENRPKYLNSPETDVYKKSETVYGLFQAKESIRKSGFVIMVEGNIDILSSHAAGIENIVAPLGTALTSQQVKLIKRYADEIYFAFDTDAAGETALFRALELTEPEGLAVRAIDLGEYQDVDELINNDGDQTGGAKNWKKAVECAEPVIDHIMNRLAGRMDLESAASKKRYAEIVLKFISKLSSSIEKAHYLEKLSQRIKTDIDVLKKELASQPDVQSSGQSEEDRPSRGRTKAQSKSSQKLSRKDYLLALLIAHPEYTLGIDNTIFEELLDKDDKAIISKLKTGKNLQEIADKLSKRQQERLAELTLTNVSPVDTKEKFESEVKSLTLILKRESIRARIKALSYDTTEDGAAQAKLKGLTDELSQLAR
ncbi:MAG: DNA primase [Candidatus Dojkabacteria bacterium]